MGKVAYDTLLKEQPLADNNQIQAPAQAPAQASGKGAFSRLLYDWWLFEGFALLLSCILFAIAALLVYQCRWQPVSQWPTEGFTLHAVITLIATLIKATMFITVTACIGQLKWQHFSTAKARPVIDMDRIESVARGTTGSAMYLIRFGPFHYMSLAAGLTILSLLLNSAVVNMLDTKMGWYQKLTSQDARLGTTNRYDEILSTDDVNKNFYPPLAMQAATITGWWYQVADDVLRQFNANSYCATGNCTWEGWSTLAIRFQCAPATVKLVENTTDYFSPEANIVLYRNDTYKTIYNQTAQSEIPDSSTFSPSGPKALGNTSVILHISAIGINTASQEPEAAECVVYWAAIKTQTHRMINGTLETFWQVDEEYSIPDAVNNSSSNSSDIVINPSWKQEPGCVFYDKQYPMHDPACRFTVTEEAHVGLQNFLGSFLTMNIYEITATTQRIISADAMNALVVGMSDFDGIFQALNGFMNYTTSFMTLQVTRSNSALDGQLWSAGAFGTLWSFESLYVANWRWASYPALMLVASGALFATTAWLSRREAIWKNSFLPTLYHGFGTSGEGETQDIRELATMEKAAGEQRVRMVESEEWVGKRLRVVQNNAG